MVALREARRVRGLQAEIKRQIRAGARTVTDVIITEQDPGNLTVYDLLVSQKRWGAVRARRALLRVGVPEKKELRTLTERQRRALVILLDG